jgi:hypothetical protein
MSLQFLRNSFVELLFVRHHVVGLVDVSLLSLLGTLNVL